MGETAFRSPGQWCWPELATTDTEGAKAFYGGLFGWTAMDVASSGGNYTIFRLGGTDCAAGYRMAKEQQAPVHWLNYVKVLSADAAAERAASLGGSVVAGPFEVEGVGRMAAIRDPGGVGFAVWEDGSHRGAATGGESGAHCWTELMTHDAEAAKAFYGGLFGWSIQESRQLGFTYIQFIQDGLPVGGLMPMEGPEWAGLPDHFMQYFVVADCAASVTRAAQLGGRTCVPPKSVPTVGTFAILEDPGGATFGILQPERSA